MRVIAGVSRNTRLATLEGDDVTRPTIDRVKESMFSSVHFMVEGAKVLDLYAGSGQLGIEALSRGAQRCVFTDENREAISVIRSNLKVANLAEKASVAQISAQSYLASCKEKFDLVILDPPYKQNNVADILPLVEKVVSEGAIVIAETEYGASLPQECGCLKLKKQYKYGAIALSRYEVEF